MKLGIPKEILPGERRVAALPETVARYVAVGFEVVVETGAGRGVFRSDGEYAAAGARIEPEAGALYRAADVVLKVKQPIHNDQTGKHEALMLREGSLLITFLHPAAPANHETVGLLRDRGITALTMDAIPRTPRAQAMDALTSMSTITGYRALLAAATHLPRFVPMIGTAIGTIKPARVLVIGAGVVGLQAVATARRLGAAIQVVDIRAEARQEAGSLKGTKVAGFEVPDDVAHGEGGYARALPEALLEEERALVAGLVPEVDIAILSALVPGEVAPVLITGDMVGRMKPGSVIVDVSIDQGGNCAVTEAGVEKRVDDVYVCGTANIPGSMAVDATWLYAHNMLHFVENLFPEGPGQPALDDEIVRHTLVTMGGQVHHPGTLKALARAAAA